MGIRIEPYGPTAREEARALLREQAEGLAAGGVDLFIIETFGDLLHGGRWGAWTWDHTIH